MNKFFFLLAIVFNSLIGFSQQKPTSLSGKGVSPLSTHNQQHTTNTYAVVIGISDYQDPGIPDLQFADKDAEAFANYLMSNAGGKLDHDHLKILINSQATMAQFANVLDWLMENVKEGDQAIIYFSGHGDVEKRTLTQPGFLLCWDAPARVYMAGGAFALPMLQEVISTLSIQNKAKVIVITDACRSGKLAGSSVSGAQATAANLAKQYANEIKIMSCQPNEYSIEGEEWGGGRGAFSYHLLDALYGLADMNNDKYVSLQEVGRYLEDHVTIEVAPIHQVPMTIGNRSERLTMVNETLLASIKSGRLNQTQMLSAIDSRGIEDVILAELDSMTRKNYMLFKKALKDKIFLEPVHACAERYYAQLMQEPKLGLLHSTMKRNYAAALQDDAQQTLNDWLKTNSDATFVANPDNSNKYLSKAVFTEKVKSFPACLDRAAELLGNQHYMYKTLKARKYFFKGYLLANSSLNRDKTLGETALGLFRQSLEWQTEQPHVYWQMSRVFAYNFRQPDSLIYYTQLANQLYPNWIMPGANAAYILSFDYHQLDQAKPFLDHINRIDSNSVLVLHNWAVYNFIKNDFLESERQLKKAISIESLDKGCWNDLGFVYLNTHRYDEAEMIFKKAIALDSTNIEPWCNLGQLYFKTGRYDEAELILKRAVLKDTTSIAILSNLGNCYLEKRQFSAAELVYQKIIKLDSMNSFAMSSLGRIFGQTQRLIEAEQIIKKAIAIDSTIPHTWNELGFLYYNSRKFVEAEPAFLKAISLDSNYVSGWNNLAAIYSQTGPYDKAVYYANKALSLDTTSGFPWNVLGFVYLNQGKYTEAEQAFIKANQILDSTFANPFKHLGMVYFKTNRPEEARQNFQIALAINPHYAAAMLGMAYLLTSEGNLKEAISYVEQAIKKGSGFDQLENDAELALLRNHSSWKALMKKYFPEKLK